MKIKLVLLKNGSGSGYSLAIRFFSLGKHCYYSLKIPINPRDFNPSTGFLKPSHPKAFEINNHIRTLSLRADEFLLSLLVERRQLSAPELRQAFVANCLGQARKVLHLHEAMLDYAERFAQDGYKLFSTTNAKYVEKVAPELNALTITANDLNDLRDALLKHYSQTSVLNCFGTIRAVMNKLTEEGAILGHNNPFMNGYKHGLKAAKKDIKMSAAEFVQFFAHVPVPGTQTYMHRAFVFATLAAGMRVRDLLLLKRDQLDGDKLIYKASKTGKKFEMQLSAIEINICHEMMAVHDSPYIFPFMDGYEETFRNINIRAGLFGYHLKAIARDIPLRKELQEKLSMHVARHTFTALADEMGLQITVIQSMLGHANINQTRDYIGSLNPQRGQKERLFLVERLLG